MVLLSREGQVFVGKLWLKSLDVLTVSVIFGVF